MPQKVGSAACWNTVLRAFFFSVAAAAVACGVPLAVEGLAAAAAAAAGVAGGVTIAASTDGLAACSGAGLDNVDADAAACPVEADDVPARVLLPSTPAALASPITAVSCWVRELDLACSSSLASSSSLSDAASSPSLPSPRPERVGDL